MSSSRGQTGKLNKNRLQDFGMKLAALASLLLPGMAFAAWTTPDFPTFTEEGTGRFISQNEVAKGTRPLQINFDQQCWQPVGTIKLNQMLSMEPCRGAPAQWRVFREGLYTLDVDTRSGTPTLMISLKETETASAVTPQLRQCPKWQGQPLTIAVGQTFAEGSKVRDFYSGNVATVSGGKVTLQPAPNSNGLLLLERAETDAIAPFSWHNATVYFVLTDRFVNGNPANDNSYGRHKDGMQEIGTFHGGDLQGLTSRLDYLQQLGVNALWISSPLEQIHGWVGGGTKGDFPHYAYHGYYAQDWTKLDANMGTEQTCVAWSMRRTKRGMRILFDVVMNHTGYATLADMQTFKFGSLYLQGEN
jgi:alpha-amylase